MALRGDLEKILRGVISRRYSLSEPLSQLSITNPPKGMVGEYATPVALQLSKKLNMQPKQVAEDIAADCRELLGDIMESISVEGPGYINFVVAQKTLSQNLKMILQKKDRYGSANIGRGKLINVEFISANPTGPLTLANGRGGFFGDTLSSLLTLAGYRVTREYYVNDRGNQVNVLAESVLRKYFSRSGIPTEYPDYCYQGVYIDELAKQLHMPNYNLAKTSISEIRDKIKDKVVAKMLKEIQRVVEKKMHITFDTWFSEKSLYAAGGPVEKTLQRMQDEGAVYEKDGALWLKTSEHGDEKDRVIKKSDGEHTYFLPDIAYHLDKLDERHAHQAITILGADHHGYVGRMQAAMDMFGHKGRVHIILMQLVRLLQGGKEVRMSKRRGTYVEIEEVLDEVGVDAARYFFLMYAPSTHMDFNLDLAKEQSEKNPVYYVQYAHARICSILRVVKEKGTIRKKTDVKTFSKATRSLLVMLLRWPDIVMSSAETYAVHQLPVYAHELATAFHAFYDSDRVMAQDNSVDPFLLSVAEATRQVLQNVLQCMGIRAPEKMHKEP